MNEPMTLKCSVCRRLFTGDPAYLRATIWPHSRQHKRRASFSGEFVLSCNCGECDFCRKKEAARVSAEQYRDDEIAARHTGGD